MLAVQTGIDPVAIADLDGRWFDALERAAARRWPIDVELAAATLETLHGLFRSFLAVHSPKGAQLPEPLVVPRPDAPAAVDADSLPASAAATVSASEFAGMFAGDVRGV